MCIQIPGHPVKCRPGWDLPFCPAPRWCWSGNQASQGFRPNSLWLPAPMAALPGQLLGASQGPSSPLAHTALRTRCRQLKQIMVTILQPALVETCLVPGTGRALYTAPYFKLTSLVCCWTYLTHGRLRFQNVELPDCSRTVSKFWDVGCRAER